MIVVDTSVFVDAIIPFDRGRHHKSTTVLDVISERELRSLSLNCWQSSYLLY